MLEEITLEQLKQMNFEQLELLAKEVRQEIITTVSKNGGHLASNLGVVELTIALHKVFDSPKDKLIFDVSHQTYAHKLLTGRYKDFSQLRKFEGISGLQNMMKVIMMLLKLDIAQQLSQPVLDILKLVKTFLKNWRSGRNCW